MRTHQIRASVLNTSEILAEFASHPPHLALVFGPVNALREPELLQRIEAAMPGVRVAGCSTAGEISKDGVTDDEAVITAVNFDHPAFDVATVHLDGMKDSFDAGRRLGTTLSKPELHHVLVFALGVGINGSALIEGIRAATADQVVVCGGLAGDGGAFEETYTLSNAGASSRSIVAVGFYDTRLHIAHGSFGGWQPFGPARRVTKCDHNVLHELDGEPALEVYKRYLGEYAKDLPASGLLFPFGIVGENHQMAGIIRTILGVDEAAGSLILAGEIPGDGSLQLMHASTDKLVDGAMAAADHARRGLDIQGASLTLMVSCVGRKLIMGGRVDEEVEAVADVLAHEGTVAGFYSYGEISPHLGAVDCQLHNQTMTITHMVEA